MRDDRRSARFQDAAQIMGAIAAAIGAVVLLGGWAVGVDPLKSLVGQIAMKANAAAGLTLCGVALFMLARPGSRFRRAARALAIAAGALGFITLLEYATGHRLGVDELLFRDTTPEASEYAPGRMAPQAAVGLMLTAGALVSLDWRPRFPWPSGVMAAIVCALAGAALLGHAYDLSSFYNVKPFTGMVGHAAVSFLLLALGIWCARPDRGVVAGVTADSTSGMLLRFLLPPAFAVPLMVGMLVSVGERHGLYGDGEGIALLIVATVFGCITFAVAAARTLQSLDAERRRSDLRLLEQTHRYRMLVERLPLVTYADKLDAQSTPVYVAPQIEATLGFTPEEWVADPALFERLLHPDDRERVCAEIARFRETGDPMSCEYRLRTKDGRYAWVHDETIQVFDSASDELRAQGYMVDITARKDAEQAQRELENQLTHAQKIETVGQLAGGIAHDFNNVLGAIMAFAGFAAEKARELPDVAYDIAQIKRSAERGAELTNQLLVFSRNDVVRTRVIDLGRVVDDAYTLVHPLLGDDLTLQMSLPEDCRIDADPTQIHRVVLNLALNARAAMPDGGLLDVRVERVDEAHVRLTVTDTGSGMSPDVAARAFEPFYTTKPTGEGSGLGLSTVYGIVTRLGGHIELDTKLGAGTTVKMLFPSAPAETPAEYAATAQPREGLVLVVDDDEAMRATTSRMLKQSGYDVLEARDGVDALEQYERADRRPDLLVTDVVMPRMTGTELADAVNALDPDARIVFMSGYAEDLDESYDDVPLVAKPFTAEVLLTAVGEALAVGVSR